MLRLEQPARMAGDHQRLDEPAFRTTIASATAGSLIA